MKEQTAVEWLENQIKNSKHYYSLMKELNSRSTIAQSNIFEQAKKIEKEQIINSFVECWKENMPDGYECKLSAEEYYNETFKQQEQ